MAQQPLVGQGLHIIEASRPHLIGLLCTSDQLVAETSTWKRTTLTTDRLPCPPVGFKPAIPASKRLLTHALDHATTGIGNWLKIKIKLFFWLPTLHALWSLQILSWLRHAFVVMLNFFTLLRMVNFAIMVTLITNFTNTICVTVVTTDRKKTNFGSPTVS